MTRGLGALVFALALAGCSSAGGGKHAGELPPTPTPVVKTGSGTIQLREVIASDETGAEHQADFKDFDCAATSPPLGRQRTRDIACDARGHKYLLRPVAWEGMPASAAATVPYRGAGWVLDIKLGTTGAQAFGRISRKLYASGGQLAILVGGRVISTAVFNGVITSGELEIAGIDKASAQALAGQLG
jgi:preprotein translocase subunit SecD